MRPGEAVYTPAIYLIGNIIYDSKGNEILRVSPTASAKNDLTITNAATGNAPSLSATGDDSNIGLHLISKGTGNVRLQSGSNDRLVINGVAKTIVDGSATSLFESAVAAGASVGGLVHWHIFASDGTDHQGLSGITSYAAVNKAGTCTRAITNATGNDAKAVSSGTLTTAWTCTDDTNKITVKVQPTGSLTETTYNIVYTVFPLQGAVTIL